MDTNTGSPTGGIKTIVRIENLAILLLVILAYIHLHLNWWLFAALLFAPDIALTAYLANPRLGAQCYNLGHSYIGPLTLLGAAAAYPRLIPFALIWLAHVSMDRALGYGLKYSTAFTDTHLGKIGHPTTKA
jgi:hypothetical protein